jgi:hypothetical protein
LAIRDEAALEDDNVRTEKLPRLHRASQGKEYLQVGTITPHGGRRGIAKPPADGIFDLPGTAYFELPRDSGRAVQHR